MISSIQHETHLILQLISKDLLMQGVYGRITNINTVKAMALVCKQWQHWIYSEAGPFSILGCAKIEAVRAKKHPCGPINKLNQLMMVKGRMWFDFVKNYLAHPSPKQIPKGPSINFVTEKGITPLQKAIDLAFQDKKYLPLISILIEHGADPFQKIPMIQNRQNSQSMPDLNNHFIYIFDRCLIKSSEQNLLDMIEMAEYVGKGVLKCCPKGKNLFHYSFFSDSTRKSFYEWYLKQGANIDKLSDKGKTPLHKALYYQTPWSFSYDSDMALGLMEAGASVAIPTSSGDYPIHLIVKNVHSESKDLLETLLKKSPQQIYAKDAQGHLPLWWAIRNGKEPFRDLLLSWMDTSSLENKNKFLLPFLKFLKAKFIGDWGIESKYCKHDYDKYLISPLKYVIKTDEQTEINRQSLNCLLEGLSSTPAEKKALLTASLDDKGNTFYHLLAVSDPCLLKLLHSKDSALNEIFLTKNHKGETVFDFKEKGIHTLKFIMACDQGNQETVQEYINHPSLGCDIHVVDEKNHSLLHLVVIRALHQKLTYERLEKYYDILKMLLDAGVNPNGANVSGETPLSYSYCKTSELPFSSLLIDSGSHPRIKNNRSKIQTIEITLKDVFRGAAPLY